MGKGVQVVGIDTWNGSAAQVRNFAVAVGATFPIGINGGQVASDWGITWNSYAIIDRADTIRFVSSQAGSYSEFFTRDVAEMKAVLDGLTMTVGVVPEPDALPVRFAIKQAAPNPFSHNTNISYSIAPGGPGARYTLSVFDILGREIRPIVNSALPAGDYSALWDGSNSKNRRVSSGIYFVVLSNGREPSDVLRIVYLRD